MSETNIPSTISAVSPPSSPNGIAEIEALLSTQLEQERANNARSMKMSFGAVAFVGIYLVWISSAVGAFLDPEGLALAASGFAVDAVPAAAAQIRAVVVDGAPDLARIGAEAVIDQIPGYRQALEAEIDPVIDQVCAVLADAAVKKMSTQAGDANAKYADDAAYEKAAEAAMASLDGVLAEAMDEKDEDGVSPRSSIESSLTQLKKIDVELKRLAKKGGNPAERELLLAWLNVLGQSPSLKTEKPSASQKGAPPE